MCGNSTEKHIILLYTVFFLVQKNLKNYITFSRCPGFGTKRTGYDNIKKANTAGNTIEGRMSYYA